MWHCSTRLEHGGGQQACCANALAKRLVLTLQHSVPRCDVAHHRRLLGHQPLQTIQPLAQQLALVHDQALQSLQALVQGHQQGNAVPPSLVHRLPPLYPVLR